MNIIKLKQDINHKSEERKGIIAVVYGQPEAKARKAVAGGQSEVIGKMAVSGGKLKPHQESGQLKGD